MPQKTVEVDFVRYDGETLEQALEALWAGHNVSVSLAREVGDAGHPVARIEGDETEVGKFLLFHHYSLTEHGM